MIPGVFPVNPLMHGRDWGAVRCTNPDCHAKPEVRDGVTHAKDAKCSEEHQLAAIRRWNTRGQTISRHTAGDSPKRKRKP